MTGPRCTATCGHGGQCSRGALTGRRPLLCRQHLLRSEGAGLLTIKLWRPAPIDEADPIYQRHMVAVADCMRRGVPLFGGGLPWPGRCRR